MELFVGGGTYCLHALFTAKRGWVGSDRRLANLK